MVEIEFTSAEHESEWNAWYSPHLGTLLTVPGFETAQRLHEVSGKSPGYLAVYTVTSPEVYDSAAYASIGGGGAASARWHEYIRRNRNLLSGLYRVPEVTEDARLVVCDESTCLPDAPDLLFAHLTPVALDRSVKERFLAVCPAGRVRELGLAVAEGVRVYQPLSPRLLPNRDG